MVVVTAGEAVRTNMICWRVCFTLLEWRKGKILDPYFEIFFKIISFDELKSLKLLFYS